MKETCNRRILHVVFASDENFVIQLEIAVRSLIKACSHAAVAIHVLDCEIRNETWRLLAVRLQAYAQKVRTEVEFFRHVVDLKEFSTFRTWNASRATYARLMIPNLLQGVRYCIYSDCDMLFFSNPSVLIDQLRNSGKMIAGHQNPRGLDGTMIDFDWLDKVAEPYNAHGYFCSGLVAMDLEQFRTHDMMDRVMAFLSRHPDSISADQSALNSCCRDHSKLIEGNWGLFPMECYGVKGEILAIHYSAGFPWRRTTWYEYALFRRVDRIWHKFCLRETGIDFARKTRSFRQILLGRTVEFATWGLLVLGIVPKTKRQYMEFMRKVLFDHSALDRVRI